MPLWTINGTAFENHGIESCALEFVNQDTDTCRLRLVDGGTRSTAWTYGSYHTVAMDGVTVFAGWVSDNSASASAGDSGPEVILSGPWWWLTRIVFCRVLQGVRYSSVNLFWNTASIGPAAAMREVLAWASSQATNYGFSVGGMSPATPPAMPPPQWVDGEWCADVARKVATWCPESSMWCSYDGGRPAIHWSAPGARGSHTFAIGTAPLVSASLKRNDSLMPAGVVVIYNSTREDSDPVAVPFNQVDSFPAGAVPGAAGVLVFTLDAASYIEGASFARTLWVKARQMAWSGEITLAGEWRDVKPGDLVTVNGRDEWAGNQSIVQRVAFDSRTLTTSISLGPPKHLGISEMRDLFWWLEAAQGASQEAEPTSFTSFQVYEADLTKLGVAPYGKAVRIASGNVADGYTTRVPEWQGRALDSVVFPSEKITAYFPQRTYYLKVKWLPDTGEFTGIDDENNSVQIYRMLSTGRVTSAEIVTTRQNNAAPVINPLSGNTTVYGTFYFPIATVVKRNDGLVEVVQHRSGDLQLKFVPPNYLYILGQ